MTLATGYVERDEDMIAWLQVPHFWADLFNHAAELVAKSHPNPGVRHHPVIKVQVGAADAGARHPHDSIPRMLKRGHRLFFNANPAGAAIIHRQHEILQKKSASQPKQR
ncbi:hypothetical protein D3C80_1475170 [compost metagenome]